MQELKQSNVTDLRTGTDSIAHFRLILIMILAVCFVKQSELILGFQCHPLHKFDRDLKFLFTAKSWTVDL